MKLTLEQIKRIIREELENSIGGWKSIYGQSEPGKPKIADDAFQEDNDENQEEKHNERKT